MSSDENQLVEVRPRGKSRITHRRPEWQGPVICLPSSAASGGLRLAPVSQKINFLNRDLCARTPPVFFFKPPTNTTFNPPYLSSSLYLHRCLVLEEPAYTSEFPTERFPPVSLLIGQIDFKEDLRGKSTTTSCPCSFQSYTQQIFVSSSLILTVFCSVPFAK